MQSERFRATVMAGGGGGHLVRVPPEVVEALGGRGRIPVRATFDGAPYRGSVVRMGGYACIGVRKSILEQIGAGIGSEIAVTLAFDAEER
jgi:Domain of unknown function (DUF1905)